MALSEDDLENLDRSAGLARKAVGEAPFGAILIGANGQTAATSVMRVTYVALLCRFCGKDVS